MNKQKRFKAFNTSLLLAASSLLLTGCGSGSVSNSNGIRANTPSSGTTNPPLLSSASTAWSKGTYRAKSTYANLCDKPREGNNPITGEAYLDKQGSVALENHYLRSWSHENYLWYNELPDINPNSYTDTQKYFDLLKTSEPSASGGIKDRFHFYVDEVSSDQITITGERGGHGINWKIDDRKVFVLYVEPNSPASAAGISRGMEVTHINSVSLAELKQSQAEMVNEALFYPELKTSDTFTFTTIAGTTINKTVTAENVGISAVYNRSVIETSSGNVGYLSFHTFNIFDAENQLKEAFDFFNTQSVDDLVVDLRYNGGGYIFISSQLAYLVAGESRTQKEKYIQFQFNDKRDDESVDNRNTLDFISKTAVDPDNIQPLNALNLNRVYVITTKETCSASESFMNGLRGIGVEVIQIGTTTCGKPYGFTGVKNCGTEYFSIEFKTQNNQGFSRYEDGFTPVASNGDPLSNRINGCQVEDDLNALLGDTNEGMLKTALHMRANGSCPTSNNSLKVLQKTSFTQKPSLLKRPPSQSIQRLAPWEAR